MRTALFSVLVGAKVQARRVRGRPLRARLTAGRAGRGDDGPRPARPGREDEASVIAKKRKKSQLRGKKKDGRKERERVAAAKVRSGRRAGLRYSPGRPAPRETGERTVRNHVNLILSSPSVAWRTRCHVSAIARARPASHRTWRCRCSTVACDGQVHGRGRGGGRRRRLLLRRRALRGGGGRGLGRGAARGRRDALLRARLLPRGDVEWAPATSRAAAEAEAVARSQMAAMLRDARRNRCFAEAGAARLAVRRERGAARARRGSRCGARAARRSRARPGLRRGPARPAGGACGRAARRGRRAVAGHGARGGGGRRRSGRRPRLRRHRRWRRLRTYARRHARARAALNGARWRQPSARA